ncbi:16S rRNA processing protein RimM [Thermincola ferriacetica]|uniref:Ribosome maturation factor RimM n=1 Tax=Thermincola ferriacetica TaxID=281456 RepID=A0A0L6W260_9FIRM|nr:ribosome maturation factor RimM [Thermincola ferriacetica]KNZ69630.1 16S rRNA processing protein RimM [Thermincola ferriacetica]
MEQATKKLIAIGKIINTHGHKGEVKVFPLTDDPRRMEELEKVYFTSGESTRELTIKQVRYHKNFVVLSFEEIKDMNAAELLKNGEICITKDELRSLPEGSYYIFDIIGLNVFTNEGRYLGEVTDVIQTGANDVYEVRDSKSGKHYLIPALKQIVKSIDTEKKEMIICPMEGLLE